MQRILICTGVLGGGSALVFAAAAVTSLLIPPSRIVPQGQVFMTERAMPASIPFSQTLTLDQARALTTDQAVGADIVVELPAPEEAR
jgi:hypothetical protein